VTNYRDTFSQEVSNNGIDGLITDARQAQPATPSGKK
jgi:ABC-type transporter MlaC component